MKIYMAAWLSDRSLGKSLTKKRGNRRLLSFFFLTDQGISQDQFIQYIETGRLDPRKNKEE